MVVFNVFGFWEGKITSTKPQGFYLPHLMPPTLGLGRHRYVRLELWAGRF